MHAKMNLPPLQHKRAGNSQKAAPQITQRAEAERMTDVRHVEETLRFPFIHLPHRSRSDARSCVGLQAPELSTSSPQPKGCLTHGEQGLKTQILIWSRCRRRRSMSQPALTQVPINPPKPPWISFRRVLSSGNSLPPSSELLGQQHTAGARLLDPQQEGKARKTHN